MNRQLAEAFDDVFGEENGAIFFIVPSRVVINWIDDMDIGWMYGRVVRESKDVYELVNEYGRIYCRQRRCCGPRRGWQDCRSGIVVSRWGL